VALQRFDRIVSASACVHNFRVGTKQHFVPLLHVHHE